MEAESESLIAVVLYEWGAAWAGPRSYLSATYLTSVHAIPCCKVDGETTEIPSYNAVKVADGFRGAAQCSEGRWPGVSVELLVSAVATVQNGEANTRTLSSTYSPVVLCDLLSRVAGGSFEITVFASSTSTQIVLYRKVDL